MTQPDKIAESLRGVLMRRATVDAATQVMGVEEGQFGFYAYFRDGTKIAVHVAVATELVKE
jgi:hypothetical protein